MTETFDSEDFITRLAGLYRDCERLAVSAQNLVTSTARRLDALRRNGYLRLAELGEALLAVQEARPAEFEQWFAAHRMRLGFSLRTAYRCKAAARLVREHGLDAALGLALGGSDRHRPEPFLCLSIRVPVAPGEIPAEEIPAMMERLRPAVEVYELLEARSAGELASA